MGRYNNIRESKRFYEQKYEIILGRMREFK